MTTLEAVKVHEEQEQYQSSYRQATGEFTHQLIYFHSNGEYEGFFAYGETAEQAEENCLDRVKRKVAMSGMMFNESRVFDTSILRTLNHTDVLTINDDFIYSKRGEKL
ncbi:MAG: hypothetical protein ABS904_00285 [Solibacillus isronensis]